MLICISTEQHSMNSEISPGISLNGTSSETKLQQLTNEIIRVIHTELKEGDSLPSVNALSRSLNISRDTVFKAYRELKRRRIVDSTPTKGYFVNREMNRVLLLLDYYSPFKDLVYQEIGKNLMGKFSLDLVFHHYNKNLFESIILESIGWYNNYVIMNFDTQEFEISEVLRKIDPSKLLLLDIPVYRWKNFTREKYSYIWQNFDDAVYDCLNDISERLKHYKSLHLIIPDHLQHPPVTVQAFEKFCMVKKIPHEVITTAKDIQLKRGDAYFVLRENELATILYLSRKEGLRVGEDIGILAYNDTPIYEFVASGISVISTDFREMGRKAGSFIQNGKAIREIIPTKVILRKSL